MDMFHHRVRRYRGVRHMSVITQLTNNQATGIDLVVKLAFFSSYVTLDKMLEIINSGRPYCLQASLLSSQGDRMIKAVKETRKLHQQIGG